MEGKQVEQVGQIEQVKTGWREGGKIWSFCDDLMMDVPR